MKRKLWSSDFDVDSSPKPQNKRPALENPGASPPSPKNVKLQIEDKLDSKNVKLQNEDLENHKLEIRPNDLAVHHKIQVSRNPVVVEADEMLSDRNANAVIVRSTVQELNDMTKESEQAQAMTNLQSRAMSVQREAPMIQATSKAVLDQYRTQAEEAGLDLDDYLQDFVGPLHEPKNDHAMRAQARFIDETSQASREMSRDNPEVSAIMREILQSVPSNNEVMATQVMREILEARDRATELYLKVPMVNRGQRPVLQMWALSKRKPMCDLAASILARLED